MSDQYSLSGGEVQCVVQDVFYPDSRVLPECVKVRFLSLRLQRLLVVFLIAEINFLCCFSPSLAASAEYKASGRNLMRT